MLFLAFVVKLNSVIQSPKMTTNEFAGVTSFPVFVVQDVAIMVGPSHLLNQVSKCKTCHQEEMKRQGKETLSAMKERISAVAHKWPCSKLHLALLLTLHTNL